MTDWDIISPRLAGTLLVARRRLKFCPSRRRIPWPHRITLCNFMYKTRRPRRRGQDKTVSTKPWSSRWQSNEMTTTRWNEVIKSQPVVIPLVLAASGWTGGGPSDRWCSTRPMESPGNHLCRVSLLDRVCLKNWSPHWLRPRNYYSIQTQQQRTGSVEWLLDSGTSQHGNR